MEITNNYKSARGCVDFVHNGCCVGISGFAGAGDPKSLPVAIADKANREHALGREFKIKLISGASTGYPVDGVLTDAGAISYRAPYQTSNELIKVINKGEIDYVDMHLSSVTDDLRYGNLPDIDFAIIEVADVKVS